LERIGDTWYYRRVVPPDARAAFGKRTIRISLRTTSRVKAMRLEKKHDIDFESRLQAARATGPDGYPRRRAERTKRFSEKIFNETEGWREQDPQWTRKRSLGVMDAELLGKLDEIYEPPDSRGAPAHSTSTVG
jgi:hypothetical protein